MGTRRGPDGCWAQEEYIRIEPGDVRKISGLSFVELPQELYLEVQLLLLRRRNRNRSISFVLTILKLPIFYFNLEEIKRSLFVKF